MEVSKIGLLSNKITSLDSTFPAQDLLVQTGQLEQYGSGVYGIGHVPQLVKQNVIDIIKKEMNNINCSEISVPLMQPESLWIESGRLDKYVSQDLMFRCLTDKENYCVSPTAEEAMVAFAKPRLVSYKQLPTTFYQVGKKFRNEIRTRGFLLRGKEFEMFDAYNFSKDNDEMSRVYDQIRDAYFRIFSELGLDVCAVAADNGDIGGSQSEEFMCIDRCGEDTILYDKTTGKALNTELLERDDYKTYLKERYGISNIEGLEALKSVELGHIFKADYHYSIPMNATYIDQNGQKQYYSISTFGIGVTRTLAMIYEKSLVMGDKGVVGLALPINLAPYPVYLIPRLEDQNSAEMCKTVYQILESRGIPVLYDDRNWLTIGTKIRDSKVLGTPYTCVFGRTLEEGYLSIENNKTGEKTNVSIAEFVEIITKLYTKRNQNETVENIVKESLIQPEQNGSQR